MPFKVKMSYCYRLTFLLLAMSALAQYNNVVLIATSRHDDYNID